ncbi:MAG: hypothetical protein HQK83_19480, partial [Fibrobacteria bacterium]|nr:hypothetical protein [Fibrobacteria bacterium]
VFSPNSTHNISGNTYWDSLFHFSEYFFDSTETVYLRAFVDFQGAPVASGSVQVVLKDSSGVSVTTLSLTEAGPTGFYEGRWQTDNVDPGPYEAVFTFTGATYMVSSTSPLHIYPLSGVSAYRLDFNQDKHADFVLENKHLVAVYDGREGGEKSLLYLQQKTSDTGFTFTGLPEADLAGRGEAATEGGAAPVLHSFSFTQQGERLATSELQYKEDVSKPFYPSLISILIIDDDDGSGTDAAYRFNTVLSGLGHTITQETSGATNSATWGNYDLLIWAASDDLSPFSNGNTGLRDALIDYVNAGGRLLIEGGEVGYIAANNNWNTFMTKVLHIPDIFYGDGTDIQNEELIVDASFHRLYTTPNQLPSTLYINPASNNNDYGNADILEALSDAIMVYSWGSLVGSVSRNPVGGIVAYGESIYSNTGNIIFFSFDLLALDNSADEAALIENAVEWLKSENAVQTSFDFSVGMRNEDADYLEYMISDFDAGIDDIQEMFNPLSGKLGVSEDDDRYHAGEGDDGLVLDLVESTWTDFNFASAEKHYMAVYDNSDGDDDLDNVIAWVHFPDAAALPLKDFACRRDSGKASIRLRFDTETGNVNSKARFLLAFTQGNFMKIEQWMPSVAMGEYPAPNFMTAPSSLSVSASPGNWELGMLSANEIVRSTDMDKIMISNNSAVNETFSLHLSTSGTSWTPGWIASGVDIYVLWGLFCGTTESPGASLFQSEDVIFSETPVSATATVFGDNSLGANGVNVPFGTDISLWFQFQAPQSTADKNVQSITVTIGAEQAL